MGSDSDLAAMRGCLDTLKGFGIDHEAFVLSAHRTPDETGEFAKGAIDAGFRVIIAAAGGAAHLGGVIASMTTLPIIGVPLASSAIGGLDALYSVVQMPPGVPVAAVSVGEWGATNAAVFAAQILAVGDEAMAAKVKQYKSDLADKVKAKAAKLKDALGG